MDETEEHNLNIPVEMLKTLRKSFKNRTFLTRILRNCWSMAKVSYKRNDKKMSAENYREITLQNIILQVFTKLFLEEICKPVDLREKQQGFRRTVPRLKHSLM